MGNDIVVPYSGHIAGGLQIGTDVVINGRVKHHGQSFSINLCVGRTYDQDCALHFNPRFNEGKVVRNHMQGGAWGQEESSGGMVFHRNMNFEVHMKVNPEGYVVTVNNRRFCTFGHRMAYQSIQYIYIEGDVFINYLQFRKGHSVPSYTPQPVPSYNPTPPYQPPVPSYVPTPAPPMPYPSGGGAVGPIFNPPVPITSSIPGGFYPGKIIYITGSPFPNASRFTVNLQCGPYDSGDFTMHFDVRFNYGSDRNQIIRTHKQGGSYGNEEKHLNYFPFFPNTNFELMMLCEPQAIKVAVNGQHLLEFYHRIQPPQRADHLNINGDCRLTQIRFQ